MKKRKNSKPRVRVVTLRIPQGSVPDQLLERVCKDREIAAISSAAVHLFMTGAIALYPERTEEIESSPWFRGAGRPKKPKKGGMLDRLSRIHLQRRKQGIEVGEL